MIVLPVLIRPRPKFRPKALPFLATISSSPSFSVQWIVSRRAEGHFNSLGDIYRKRITLNVKIGKEARRRFDVPVISSGPLLKKQVGFKVKDLSFFLLV